LAKRLDEKGIKIIHQAGERNIQEVRQLYRDINVKATVFGFTDKLSDYMAEADFNSKGSRFYSMGVISDWLSYSLYTIPLCYTADLA